MLDPKREFSVAPLVIPASPLTLPVCFLAAHPLWRNLTNSGGEMGSATAALKGILLHQPQARTQN